MNDTSERIISEIEKLDVSALSPEDVKDACIDIAKKVNKRVLIDNRYHPCFCGNNRRKHNIIYGDEKVPGKNNWYYSIGRELICTKCGFSVRKLYPKGAHSFHNSVTLEMKNEWNLRVPAISYEEN